MKNDGQEFTPEQVEQQIDLFTSFPNTWSDPSSDARLISELYQVYTEDDFIARRAWKRLAEQANIASPRPVAGNATFQDRPPMDARANWQKGPHIMQIETPQKRSPKRLGRFLGLCASLLIVAALVAGMAIVLNNAHQQPGKFSTASPDTKTPTPVVNEGKVIYHSGSIPASMHIAWSPDGQRIAVTTSKTQFGPWQLKSWDALTGQHVVTYSISNLPLYGVEAFTSVAWSPDGHSLAVASFTGKVDIFDAQSGKLIRTVSPALALNSASTLPLAASGGVAKSPLSSLFPQSGGGTGSSPEIAWSPDGTYLAESVTSKIVIWNASTSSPVKQITDNYPSNLRALWQPHGNLLAIIGCSDTTCMPNPNNTVEASIWDTTTWHLVKQYPGVVSLDWSPDGKQLALVGPDRQSVVIVEALTGQTVKQSIGFPKTQITAIHWSPDGNRLAEESPTGTITIWSIPDGKMLYTFPQYASEAAWSPDGKYISCVQDIKASNGYASMEIAIWIA